MVKKDKTMRNLTTAVFLTFIFCAVSVSGKDSAEASKQDSFFEAVTSSLMSGTKKVFGKVKNFLGFDNRSFHDTLWEERLKDWQNRHSAVPQSLPRATFKLNKHSSSRSYRSSHRSFRSSHSHRTRHVRRCRTHHVRRRSRR